MIAGKRAVERLRRIYPGSPGWEREAILGDLLWLSTRGLMRTTDFRAYGHEEVMEFKRRGRPIVFVCWHGHDFLNLGGYQMVFGWDVRSVIMVRDDWNGMVLHRFGQRMGIDVITLPGTDPTSIQWARSVVRVIDLVKRGYDGLLAVDGPEGPRYQVKPGAALMARRAGAVIVPGAAAAFPSIQLRGRWDEHLVPLPFSRAVMHFGPIIDPAPPNGPQPTVEELQERIGDALTRGTRRAQELTRRRG